MHLFGAYSYVYWQGAGPLRSRLVDSSHQSSSEQLRAAPLGAEWLRRGSVGSVRWRFRRDGSSGRLIGESGDRSVCVGGGGGGHLLLFCPYHVLW